MLYIVSTPIGNLSDITLRAIEILKSCSYILCEDTRKSLILLKKYDIQKPLHSYHKFSESKKSSKIIDDLKDGLDIALISDAGTPTICDPGMELVQKCKNENIQVTAIPGPCALIMALTLSGFCNSSFQFLGFLPKKDSELKNQIIQMLLYEGTSIAYETSLRIEKTLQLIDKLCKSRLLCVARELTKNFEEILKGTASELLNIFKEKKPKGELILLSDKSSDSFFSQMTEKECFDWLCETYNLSTAEAIKTTAQLQNKSKSTIYKVIHEL